MRLQKLTAVMTLLASATLLASCATTDLNVFTRKLDANNTTIDSMDDAQEETDTFETANAIIHPLSLNQTDNMTVGQKMDLVLELRESIKTKQQTLNTLKPTIREDIATLKAAVQQFKTLGLTLSDEEKATLSALGSELDGIKVELKATVGLVYKKIVEWRGHYTLENLDAILETYQIADDAMTVRVTGVSRVSEIIDEVNNLLAVRIG